MSLILPKGPRCVFFAEDIRTLISIRNHWNRVAEVSNPLRGTI
jgi:hypothetical protein